MDDTSSRVMDDTSYLPTGKMWVVFQNVFHSNIEKNEIGAAVPAFTTATGTFLSSSPSIV